MLSSGRRQDGVSRILLQGILSLYVLAAALLPLGHHDIACHLKSTTHCSTCVVGSSGETTPHAVPVLVPGDDAGTANGGETARFIGLCAGPSFGRSPPSA
jgi:hypothetical protein